MGNQNHQPFEYVLEDYLELKACLRTSKTKPIKTFLFSQKRGGWILSPVEGFSLDRHLVLFRQGDPNSFKHLVFLNPTDGRIQVKQI